jgi:hypothetical protein
MSEQSLKPEPLRNSSKLADSLMQPLMHTLGGFKSDSLQETHPWHIQKIDPSLINSELSTKVKGSSEEKMNSHNIFLFHAPVFGGWKHYTLLEAAEEEFHIGWIAKVRGELSQAAIHRLKISTGQVRMLDGPKDSETEYFAVNPDGIQIDLKISGKGILGDNQFPDTRLL